MIKGLKNKNKIEDIQLIENFDFSNSWWDSFDTISKYILGECLPEHPLETEITIERFSNDDNIWLNRSAILFTWVTGKKQILIY